jgi:hypothetical protein
MDLSNHLSFEVCRSSFFNYLVSPALPSLLLPALSVAPLVGL